MNCKKSVVAFVLSGTKSSSPDNGRQAANDEEPRTGIDLFTRVRAAPLSDTPFDCVGDAKYACVGVLQFIGLVLGFQGRRTRAAQSRSEDLLRASEYYELRDACGEPVRRVRIDFLHVLGQWEDAWRGDNSWKGGEIVLVWPSRGTLVDNITHSTLSLWAMRCYVYVCKLILQVEMELFL